MVKKTPMGYIYKAINRAKDTIVRIFNGNEEKYKEIFNIINKRWGIQLHRPLHAVRYFLNPKFFYDKPEIKHDAKSWLIQQMKKMGKATNVVMEMMMMMILLI